MTDAGLTGAIRPKTLRPLWLTLLLALGRPVFGAPAEEDKPKPPRRHPAARPAVDVGLRPTLGDPPRPLIAALPAQSQPGEGFCAHDMV